MIVDRWMYRENVVYIYCGILFNLKKEGNPTTGDNGYECGGPCAKWNEPITDGQIPWSHLHEASKVVEYIEVETRQGVVKGLGQGVGEMESYCLAGIRSFIMQDN